MNIEIKTHHFDPHLLCIDTPLVVDTSLIQTFRLIAADQTNEKQKVTKTGAKSRNNNTL